MILKSLFRGKSIPRTGEERVVFPGGHLIVTQNGEGIPELTDI